MNAIKNISYVFNLSPKKQEYLERVINKNFPELSRKKLLDVCRTRWLDRIDVVDLFEELFIAIIMTFEEMYYSEEGKFKTKILLLKQILF